MTERAIILVAALVLLAPAPGLAQGPPTPLQPHVPAFDGAVPSWSFDESCDCLQAPDGTLRTMVENTGTRASSSYTVAWYWEAGGQREPLSVDEAHSTDVGPPLPPGGSHPHHITWQPRAGQEGPGRIVFSVTESSTTQAALPVSIAVHHVVITAGGDGPDLHPDGTAYRSMSVTNVGNTPESLQTSLTQTHPRLDERWLPSGDAVLPAGATTEFRLRLYYPFTGDVADFDFAPLADLKVSGVPRNVALAPIHIDNCHSPCPAVDLLATLTGPADALRAAPSEVLGAPFTLRNEGTATQAFQLSATGTSAWTVSSILMAGAQVDEVVLGPSESATLVVRGLAPGGAPGAPGSLRLQAIPIREGGSSSVLQAVATVRLHGPALTVAALELSGPGPYAGDPLNVTTIVRNMGDQPQAASHLQFTVASPSAGTTTSTVDFPRLLAGEQAELAVSLGAASAGDVRITANPQRATGDPVPILNTAVHRAALAVLPPLALSGVPGQRVSYQAPPHVFVVRNDGSHTEVVGVASDAGEIAGPTSFQLLPGELRQVGVSQTLPAAPGDAAAVALGVRAFLVEAPHFSASAGVATGIDDVKPPVVAWAAGPPTRWKAGTPLEIRVAAQDDTALASAWLTITNATASRDVPLSGPSPWGLSVTLGSGVHELSAHARDVHGNTGATPQQDLNVTRAVAPLVLDLRAAATGNNTFRITARVLAPEGVRAVFLILDGTPQPLGAVAAVDVQVLLAPGDHTVGLQATGLDGLVAANEISFLASSPAGATVPTTPAPARNAPAPAGLEVVMLAAVARLVARRR